jgi:hypothetical protein
MAAAGPLAEKSLPFPEQDLQGASEAMRSAGAAW